jgi:hypothetical protein
MGHDATRNSRDAAGPLKKQIPPLRGFAAPVGMTTLEEVIEVPPEYPTLRVAQDGVPGFH